MLLDNGSGDLGSASRANQYYEEAKKGERDFRKILYSHACHEPMGTAIPDVIMVHFISAQKAFGNDITTKNRDAFEKFLFLKHLAATKPNNSHQENAKLIIMGNYLDLPIITCKLHSAQSLTATLILHVNLH